MVEGNRYLRWIENYVAEDYVSAAKTGRELLEEGGRRLSPERVEEIVEIFREGARLEGLFWGMGLDFHQRSEDAE
jgi:thiaminase